MGYEVDGEVCEKVKLSLLELQSNRDGFCYFGILKLRVYNLQF